MATPNYKAGLNGNEGMQSEMPFASPSSAGSPKVSKKSKKKKSSKSYRERGDKQACILALHICIRDLHDKMEAEKLFPGSDRRWNTEAKGRKWIASQIEESYRKRGFIEDSDPFPWRKSFLLDQFIGYRKLNDQEKECAKQWVLLS